MEKTIQVIGKANINFKPEITIISLKFERKFKKYVEAVNASAIDLASTREALTKIGFNKESLKTSYFSIKPYFEYVSENGISKDKQMGYKYEQSLTFSFKISNELLSKVIITLTSLKTNPKIDIFYTIEDMKKARDLVLQKCVKNAIKTAQVLANAANVELCDILEIKPSFDDSDYFENSYRNIRCDYSESSSSVDLDMDPSDLNIKDEVKLIFRIK